jgi:hypothetical protein
MAKCIYCDKWCGLFDSYHQDCLNGIKGGKTKAEIWNAVNAPRLGQLKPVTASGVFWAIFGALWLFAATAAILGEIVKALLF